MSIWGNAVPEYYISKFRKNFAGRQERIAAITTKEEAEAELGIEITDKEWNSGEAFIGRGGFGAWDFEI